MGNYILLPADIQHLKGLVYAELLEEKLDNESREHLIRILKKLEYLEVYT